MKCLGYVSGADACEINLQVSALMEAGCDQIFSDVNEQRTERTKLLKIIKPGDRIIVWRLDKFACSVNDLAVQLKESQNREIAFQTLQENLDLGDDNQDTFNELVAAMADIETRLQQG